MQSYTQIQHMLMTTFKRSIWSKFAKAITQYDLIHHGDKIAVCISGGKDSFLMGVLFNELVKHQTVDFEVIFLVMDPGYSDVHRQQIEQNAKQLNLAIQIFDTQIFEEVATFSKSSCYRCATKRRGSLYHMAQLLGCNKIALGHHFNDVVETVMMNQLLNGQYACMMPKLKAQNYEHMELIRPLYLVHETAIKQWVAKSELTFLQCACRFTEISCHDYRHSKRSHVKHLISQLEVLDVRVAENIFQAMHNVKFDKIVGGVNEFDESYSFLDGYDDTVRIGSIIKTKYSLNKALELVQKDLMDYLFLKERLFQVDVSLDELFQRKFNGLFKMRQRSKQFYGVFYAYLEKHKCDDTLNFEKVVRYLYDQFNRVEASFASKMLSVINDEFPIWDKGILLALGYKLPIIQKQGRCDEAILYYQAQCEWMAQQCQNSLLIESFNARYPNVLISDIKKLDLLLFKSRA